MSSLPLVIQPRTCDRWRPYDAKRTSRFQGTVTVFQGGEKRRAALSAHKTHDRPPQRSGVRSFSLRGRDDVGDIAPCPRVALGSIENARIAFHVLDDRGMDSFAGGPT